MRKTEKAKNRFLKKVTRKKVKKGKAFVEAKFPQLPLNIRHDLSFFVKIANVHPETMLELAGNEFIEKEDFWLEVIRHGNTKFLESFFPFAKSNMPEHLKNSLVFGKMLISNYNISNLPKQHSYLEFLNNNSKKDLQLATMAVSKRIEDYKWIDKSLFSDSNFIYKVFTKNKSQARDVAFYSDEKTDRNYPLAAFLREIDHEGLNKKQTDKPLMKKLMREFTAMLFQFAGPQLKNDAEFLFEIFKDEEILLRENILPYTPLKDDKNFILKLQEIMTIYNLSFHTKHSNHPEVKFSQTILTMKDKPTQAVDYIENGYLDKYFQSKSNLQKLRNRVNTLWQTALGESKDLAEKKAINESFALVSQTILNKYASKFDHKQSPKKQQKIKADKQREQ